jgi:Zn-dependent protease with chaperone function
LNYFSTLLYLMNLFDTQEHARKLAHQAKLDTLIVFLSLSLVPISINAIVTFVLCSLFSLDRFHWILSQVTGATIICIAVVTLVSGRYGRSLAGRPLGELAGWLGATPLDGRSRCLYERRTMQIVDELSLAAGIPAPQIYCMPYELGVNSGSLARGVSDAVIWITAGALREVPRPELEALLAHEVIRIIRGEAELSLELLAIMHPLFAIHSLGLQFMRVEVDDASFEHHAVYRPTGRSGLALYLLGFTLSTLGSLPALCGHALQAALLKRLPFERDLLCLVTARGDEGVLSLLKKFSQTPRLSVLANPRSYEFNHVFFSSACHRLLFLGPRVHPHPRRRLHRVDASRFYSRRDSQDHTEGVQHVTDEALYRYTPQRFLESVGDLNRQHIDHARNLLKGLPAGLHEMAKTIEGAQDISLALVLSSDKPVRLQQIEDIKRVIGRVEESQLSSTYVLVHSLSDLHLLPLVHLVIPTLRRLSVQLRSDLGRLLIKTAKRDGFRTLAQFTIAALMARLLSPQEGSMLVDEDSSRSPQVREDLALLLSFLAHSGTGSPERAVRSYCHGASLFGITQPLRPLARNSARQIFSTLQRLSWSPPSLRQHILYVCAEVLGAEGHVSIRDAEILRAIGTILSCPHAPLVLQESATGPLSRGVIGRL